MKRVLAALMLIILASVLGATVATAGSLPIWVTRTSIQPMEQPGVWIR